MLQFLKSFKIQSSLLILATTVIYGLCINNLNLWSDELYSVLMAKDSFTEMWELLTTEDSKPPLYYLYLKVILALFPKAYEIWAAHFSSFLLLVVAEVFCVTEIRKDYGDKLSLWMLWLLCFMPYSLWLSFEVRTYMLSALLLFMAMIYGLRILEKPVKSDFYKFGITSLLALYSHYYCAVGLMFVYLGILLCLLKDKTFSLYGKKFLITAFSVAVLFAPWLIVPLSTGGEISQFWYVDFEFVKFSPLFFTNPFEPEIFQSEFYMATQFIAISFSFIALSGILELHQAPVKLKRLYWFSFGVFIASYLLLIACSFIFRPMVTARYLKIFTLLWYVAGAVVLAYLGYFAKTFGVLCVLLFGFSYVDIYTISFDDKYAKAVQDIRSFIPKGSKLLTFDNANLICEYYLPEYTCLSVVGVKGEILRKPSMIKNIEEYSKEMPLTSFSLSIYSEPENKMECLTYNSLYRRGQPLRLCKHSQAYVQKSLQESLEFRLKKY